MPTDSEFATFVDPHRRELLAHCYRMLGSFQDAEDAVQETLLRAWRGFDNFEGRASARTWLYRIATNVCLTAAENRERRVLPSGLGGAQNDGTAPLADRRAEVLWLEPIPDHAFAGDPADVVTSRDTMRLAFVAALQNLPEILVFEIYRNRDRGPRRRLPVQEELCSQGQHLGHVHFEHTHSVQSV